ncbi:hypothetical protein MOO46_04795 [Apilactobacillus apisilvae]|uniref:WxL domain-containing protein n=1 Tax=Apilactobacillus apisilvae TaxID=2923364 RepID=A0ABY4PG79_9LACO|nr:hypothetical protein [Apilactobacillus apisilvae]UQS84572.1 hypothetical protein MOO46_04795 [Apilactobacillus apisilvae]
MINLKVMFILFICIMDLFGVDGLKKDEAKAESKASYAYINIGNKNYTQDGGYLKFNKIPKLSFDNVTSEDRTLEQFSINEDSANYDNNINISDNRQLSNKSGYNVSVSLGKFSQFDNNGNIENKNNDFKLKLDGLKISTNENSKNISQNSKIKNVILEASDKVDPGQYVGELNWTLSPTISNANEI